MHSASNQGTPWLDRWGCASLGFQITSESERRKKKQHACRRWPRPGTAQSRASLHVCACTPHRASQPVSAHTHTASPHSSSSGAPHVGVCMCRISVPAALEQIGMVTRKTAERLAARWLHTGCMCNRTVSSFSLPHPADVLSGCAGLRDGTFVSVLGALGPATNGTARVPEYMRPPSYMVHGHTCPMPGIRCPSLGANRHDSALQDNPWTHGTSAHRCLHQHNLVLRCISPRDQPEPVSREGHVAANGLAPTCPGQVVT